MSKVLIKLTTTEISFHISWKLLFTSGGNWCKVPWCGMCTSFHIRYELMW